MSYHPRPSRPKAPTPDPVTTPVMLGGEIEIDLAAVDLNRTYSFEYSVGREAYLWTGVQPQWTGKGTARFVLSPAPIGPRLRIRLEPF